MSYSNVCRPYFFHQLHTIMIKYLGSHRLKIMISKLFNWKILVFFQNENFKNELLEILEQKDEKLLQRIFSSPLEFGTAGIRGRMGPGCSQMNDLTIIQTTQGLLKYLLEVHKDSTKNRCVVIGYDGRHNSYRCIKTFMPFVLTYE